MIGTFWNLCRACPAKPVDKLHSEYRSTYRWHEYTGPRPRQDDVIRGQPPPSGGPGPAPEPEPPRLKPPGGARRVAHEDHLRADAPDNSEPILPRRRKQPLLAYRCNELFSADTARGGRMVAVGPASDLPAAGLPTDRQNTHECRRHFGVSTRMEAVVRAATRSAVDRDRDGRPAAGKMSGQQVSHALGQPSRPLSGDRTDGPAPRKSLSMGALRAQQQRSRLADDAGESEPLMASHDHDGDDLRGEEKIREDNASKEDGPRFRKEFKTEYKKKFRPFSQYDYVEGRFHKRKDDEPAPVADPPEPQQPWYTEVIELRKKAGEYKHRGWGTELAPEHMAELYNKQLLLWEQVSRRSSLSALSLAAFASPRSISKEEKERENSRRTSPSKASSLGRQRPHTAQPKLAGVHERSKSERPRKAGEKTDDNKKEGGRDVRDGPRSSRKQEFPLRHHLERTTGAGRSQSLGPGSGSGAENRSPKSTPRTAGTGHAPSAPSSATPNAAERRPRPSGDAEPEAEEPEMDLEPIVKSPPEPTRVKSPEQIIMRSPEPVNWTVPLDTGKTFTVTQNVPDGERPHATPSPAPPASNKTPEPSAAPRPAPRKPDSSLAKAPTPQPQPSSQPTQTKAAETKPTPAPAPAPTSGKTASPAKTTAPAPTPGKTASPAKTTATTAAAPKTDTTASQKSDPMTTSIMGSSSGASSLKSDPMTTSIMGSSLGGSSLKSDPMTTSMMGSSLGGSSLKSDPMTTSMMGSSLGGSSLKSDPMATSMMGSSLGGSSLKSDPMATSMMGSSLGGSSLKSDPMATSMMGSSLGGSSLRSDPMATSMMGSSLGGSSLKSDPMATSMMGSSMSSSFAPSMGSSATSLGGTDPTGPKTGSSTLKVLDDPAGPGQAPGPKVALGGSGGYRVLEAPTPPAQSAGTLDSARDRFDKFWGKEKEGHL